MSLFFAASDELSSTTGVVAIAAAAIALVALVTTAILAVRLRRVLSAQQTILGNSSERDLVNHAVSLQHGFDQLNREVRSKFEKLDSRLQSNEHRLQSSISKSAVVHYDAYGEMSGRQSTSIALLDENGTGVVMSSILHRETARLYAKGVRDGKPDIELSPEESEAIEAAQTGRQISEISE